MVAPKACRDTLPHLLAGVLYARSMTGEAREAGLSSPSAYLANVHQLYLRIGMVIGGKKRT
jgi:hypothetical protein